jgi:transcriptional regulator with XRE-family HTH domain
MAFPFGRFYENQRLPNRTACRKVKNPFGYKEMSVINRIRDIRKQKSWTLADLAEACDPATTAQTIGRLETGMRNLSIKWMDRIAAALEVDPELLVRSEASTPPQVVAILNETGADGLRTPRDAILATDLGGDMPLIVLSVEASSGEYRPGDQLWLRQLDPEDAHQAINRDVLVPRKGGRFAFGRLIDRQGTMVGILPPGAGQKQQVVGDPPWLAVAEMLVRKL